MATFVGFGTARMAKADDYRYSHHDAWSHDNHGYWDDHHSYHNYTSYRNHNGYWRTNDSGVRFFININ